MRRSLCQKTGLLSLLLLGAGPMTSAADAETSSSLSWLSPELRRLQTERQSLQQTLAGLPPAPTPEITQRLGWHSDYSASRDTVEWVELNLETPEALDSIVLIAPPPSGGRAEPGYGFPLRFRVELLGDGDETQRTLLADFTREDFPNPGLLPVVIPAGGKKAHKVRITGTRLVRSDTRFFFALGEVMLMQGHRNLGTRVEALGPDHVHASSSLGTRPDWGRINVVDGQSVIGPPLGTQTSPTFGFRSLPTSERHVKENPWVAVDLGTAMPVEEVRLFPAHPPAFAHSHGYGFPVRYEVELSAHLEGSGTLPTVYPAPQSGSYMAPPGDNPVAIGTHGQSARFVRVRVLEPHVSNGSAVLALAEMQVWSGGQNRALGRSVIASDHKEGLGWSDAALVDGFASAHDIVDWAGWLQGLSQRRETLQSLARLDARQGEIIQQFKTLGWWALAVLLLAGLVALLAAYFRQRRERQREMEELRQRISQDLHDEIGSSLGSIMLITDDALSLAREDDLRLELKEIRETAQQTMDSMRDIVRLAQSGRYGSGDLIAHLREIADRMLRGIPHTFTTDAVTELPMDQRRDLVLMFKEILHNLLRHAQATQAEIALHGTPGGLTLTVQDNGRGFVPAQVQGQGMGLTNLQRRAGKHGGRAEILSSPGQGTTLRITLPRHG